MDIEMVDRYYATQVALGNYPSPSEFREMDKETRKAWMAATSELYWEFA